MKRESLLRRPYTRRAAAPIASILLAAGLVYVTSCATSTSSSSPAGGARSTLDESASPPSPDPRVGLRAGWLDAGEASWNMRLVSNSPPPENFVGVTNSDLAFTGKYAIQGNYNGYQVWDISNPSAPELATAYFCPASQSDVSIYKNLLFVSGEGLGGRIDCGAQGVPDSVSSERLRGIRIFDATDIANPKYIANVQTCRGSHTHTVVSDPNDPSNVYIYVSGSSRVRPEAELGGCADLAPEAGPTSENFRIEVIRVPLANPEQASLASAPRIFQGLTAPPRSGARTAQDSTERELAGRGRGGRGGRGGAAPGRGGRAGPGGPAVRQGPTQCHDITVYPAIGLAGGACGGYGLLLDIRDAANPRRIDAVADSNFAFWHSATFSNDGSKILFTDEWGGGSAPRCRETDKYEWGANAIFALENDKMTFKSYYKMPAPQTRFENCVAHNGTLIPIPGREVMVQAWYQGGVSIFDWTDASNPKEIAFFDRGPLRADALASAGSWSAYWYNGYIFSSEIARGLDIFELTPSAFISQNEIDAARTVVFDEFNAQEQPKLVWPPSFALARAYIDQIERSDATLVLEGVPAVRAELARAEALSGQQRRDALTRLAAQLNDEGQDAEHGGKVRALAATLVDLANAQL